MKAFQYDGGLKFQSETLTSRLEASYGENKLKSWLESHGESSAQPIHTGLTRFSWINSWSGIEGLNLTDEFNDQYVDSAGDRASVYHHTGRQYYVGARFNF